MERECFGDSLAQLYISWHPRLRQHRGGEVDAGNRPYVGCESAGEQPGTGAHIQNACPWVWFDLLDQPTQMVRNRLVGPVECLL